VFAKDCALVTESWLLAMSLQPLEKLLSLLLHCQSCCHVLKWLSHVEIDRYGFFFRTISILIYWPLMDQ